MNNIIPYPAPSDIDLKDRIQKLVTYVIKNGKEFELKVKEKEKNNPLFEFLSNSQHEGYLYYQWHLFCTINQYTIEQINDMELTYFNKLKDICMNGMLELSIEESTQLLILLQSSTGSKETIKSIRKWILDRIYSLSNISVMIRKYILGIMKSNPTNLDLYQHILHTIYVINDLFYHADDYLTNLDNVYKKILQYSHNESIVVNIIQIIFPHLPSIFHACYSIATNDIQKDRLSRLIELWKTKDFINPNESNILLESLYCNELPLEPELIVGISPYLDSKDILPSNNPNMINHPATQPLTQLEIIQQRIQDQFNRQQQQQQIQTTINQMSYPIQQQQQQQAHMMLDNPFNNNAPPPMGFYPPAMNTTYNTNTTNVLPNTINMLPNTTNMLPNMPYPHMMMMMQQHPPPTPTSNPMMMMMLQNPPSSFISNNNTIPNHIIPVMDLVKIPVGNMSNIVKAAKKAGLQPYSTIDIMIYSGHASPYVEPGRLEAKITEFYKHADTIMKKSSPNDTTTTSNTSSFYEYNKGSSSSSMNTFKHQIDTNKEEVWEKYTLLGNNNPNMKDDDDDYHRTSSERDRNYG